MKNKNDAVSLIYVLIAMYLMTITCIYFVSYVFRKIEINDLQKNDYFKSITLSKDNLIYHEKLFATDESYFTSYIDMSNSNNPLDKRLCFYNKSFHNEKKYSKGMFYLESVVDEKGNEIFLPLDESKEYNNIILTYIKNIEDEKLYYIEKISFKYDSSLGKNKLEVITSELR